MVIEIVGLTLNSQILAIRDRIRSRDPYTATHCDRVADLSVKIAMELGVSLKGVERVYQSGIIHDIGKIEVPLEILNKEGRLTPDEFEVIQRHPDIGKRILVEAEIDERIIAIVYQHHENMDGTGYPLGISCDDVLPEARILRIADTMDAIANNRPYRTGMGIERALEIIQEDSLTKLSPDVVNACSRVFQKGYSFPNL